MNRFETMLYASLWHWALSNCMTTVPRFSIAICCQAFSFAYDILTHKVSVCIIFAAVRSPRFYQQRFSSTNADDRVLRLIETHELHRRPRRLHLSAAKLSHQFCLLHAGLCDPDAVPQAGMPCVCGRFPNRHCPHAEVEASRQKHNMKISC